MRDMGIRFDWEIQAEQVQVQNGGEDPAAKRARRLARLRLLVAITVLIALVGGIALIIVLRLHDVDLQIDQLLQNTVDAEVTALRIGDATTFLAVQHQGNADWISEQQALFAKYQTLKTQKDIQLTGRILNTQVDGRRGRVQVEEIIDGVPYVNTWFYWNFPQCDADPQTCKQRKNEEGWRHVPPDYTFWGEAGSYAGKGVTVEYNKVDDTFAVEVGLAVERWVQTACAALVCDALPEIVVQIVPDPGLQMGWTSGDSWELRVPSPYVQVARSDMPFDVNLQIQMANLVADRLVSIASNHMQPAYPADVYYLRSAVVSWLVGRFASINTNSFLISSLAAQYGDQAVGLLVKFMQPASKVDILTLVTGAPSLDKTNLDWRDFLTWRLVTEKDLVLRGDQNDFLDFYDTRDEATRNAAYQRFGASQTVEQEVVTLAQAQTAPDGTPQLLATVQVGKAPSTREEQVLFRLVDNIWRRAS
jgi:hypothetical protein